MTWAKIDDNLYQNPKVLKVSVPARWSYVASILYCSLNRSSGVIPRAALPGIHATPKMADELLAAGLWEPHPDGWQVHDYLKHNRSKERIDGISEVRREAGRASAAKRQQSVEQTGNKVLGAAATKREQFVLSGSGSGSSYPEGSGPDQEPDEQNANKLLPMDADPGMQVASAALTKAGVRWNAFIADELRDMLDDGTKGEWVQAATAIAARNGKANWPYIRAILAGWGSEGPPNREPLAQRSEPQPNQYRSSPRIVIPPVVLPPGMKHPGDHGGTA